LVFIYLSEAQTSVLPDSSESSFSLLTIFSYSFKSSLLGVDPGHLPARSAVVRLQGVGRFAQPDPQVGLGV